MDVLKFKFGRLESEDPRDSLFPVAAVLPEPDPFITEKYWWDGGWWGDQGITYHCVCYSFLHMLEDGPVIQDAIPNRRKPFLDINRFYKECQDRDPWPGNQYDGTSIRAAAKVLHHMGIIKEYRWANTVDEVVQTVLNLGPVVTGTRWYGNMSRPNRSGVMHPSGTYMGGHAYLINGVDTKKEMFRIKNSYGKHWGKNGYAYISFEDYDALLRDGGDACIAFENKMETIPSFDMLPEAVNP